MDKILILSNNDAGLYIFRKELLEKLAKNYRVFLSLPEGKYMPKLEQLGCECILAPLDRRSINPLRDARLLLHYINLLRRVKPNVVLAYTVKPNVYGGFVCRILKIPYISNITGLGTAIKNEGALKKLVLTLYKASLKNASCVFFQNEDNETFFADNEIVSGKHRLIPGSGINLEYHSFAEYPEESSDTRFLFVGRIMKDKGIEELLTAAANVKAAYPRTRFEIVGFTESDYTGGLDEAVKNDTVVFHGEQTDVRPFYRSVHAVVHPSYHEGMSNVLLEAAATGRPVLASDIPGCCEAFNEGSSGFGFEAKNDENLADALKKFIELPYAAKKRMGEAGRRKMEAEFDRNLVIKAYLEEIDLVIGRRNMTHGSI
jgi:galacturonosyltransferase